MFALVVAVSAGCGDDSSGDDGSNTEESDRDGGEPESAELKQARVTDGVNATQARADLLIEALCMNAPRCSSQQTVAQCVAAYNEEWMNLVSNNVPDACLDAELDRVACRGKLVCESVSKCASFDAPVRSSCPEDAGTMMP